MLSPGQTRMSALHVAVTKGTHMGVPLQSHDRGGDLGTLHSGSIDRKVIFQEHSLLCTGNDAADDHGE